MANFVLLHVVRYNYNLEHFNRIYDSVLEHYDDYRKLDPIVFSAAYFVVRFHSYTYLCELGELDLVEKQLRVMENEIGDEAPLEGLCLFNLTRGIFYATKGDYKTSNKYVDNAIELCKETSFNIVATAIYAQSGYNHIKLGNQQRARYCLIKSYEASKDSHFNFICLLSMAVIAEGLFLINDINTANEVALKAIELAKQALDPGLQSQALRVLSKIHAKRSHFDKAFNAIQEALHLAEILNLLPLKAHCYLDLANYHSLSNNELKAEQYIEKAHEIYNDLHIDFWVGKMPM